MQHLTERGLPAYTYIGDDGHPRVHAGPPAIHDAGTEITVLQAPGACSYISEWGTVVGDTRHLDAVVTYVLWLFGLSARPRP